MNRMRIHDRAQIHIIYLSQPFILSVRFTEFCICIFQPEISRNIADSFTFFIVLLGHFFLNEILSRNDRRFCLTSFMLQTTINRFRKHASHIHTCRQHQPTSHTRLSISCQPLFVEHSIVVDNHKRKPLRWNVCIWNFWPKRKKTFAHLLPFEVASTRNVSAKLENIFQTPHMQTNTGFGECVYGIRKRKK